ILEGSVQKVADAVHVNAQLIRAATDDHLWAESYDCKLSEGIFAVEAEVAQKVALALNAKLTGAEQQVLTRKPTNNPAAYDAYLKGTAQYFQFTEETNKAAVHSFEEAVRLDPEFAGAWAALSRTHSLIFFHYEVTAPQREAAEKALAEATRLQPNLAETQLARAYFQYWVLRDYKGALEMMQRLRTSWPSNAEVLRVMSFIYARLGQWKECVDAIDQSVGLDPRDQFTRAQSVLVHLATRDFGRSVQIADSALQIWPNDGSLLSLKAFALQASGELDDAQAVLAGTVPAKDGELDSRFGALLYQALLRRDPESVLKPFDAYSRAAGQNDGGFLLSWGTLQEAAGKISEARASFARARDKLQAQLNGQPENKELIGPLIFAFAVLGQQQDALKALDRFDALSAGDARAIGTGNELRARVFVRFGDKEKAIASLERVLSGPCDGIFGPPISPALLRLDPCWDSLRSDPRFQKLCEEKPR
ncbi:MAG: hypothetical protein ACJ74Y_09315, partial [Bryobacteraceae bacterium]